MRNKVVPHIPIQHRQPNKFVRYELEDFNDGAGNGGRLKMAYYLDKKGREQQVVHNVIWENLRY